MKYMLLFCKTPEDAQKWSAFSQTEMAQRYGRVEAWQEANKARISSPGYRLQDAHTATTVRHRDGRALVTDGPFVEGHEMISGFLIADVADLDEALAMAKTFPACSTCEVRPVVE